MSEEARVSLVRFMWIAAMIGLFAVNIGAGIIGELTIAHISVIITILGIAVVGTPIILRFKPDEGEELQKAKRQRIDQMLRDMSDDDLLVLKQRLSTQDYSDETILDYLSDDGELIARR